MKPKTQFALLITLLTITMIGSATLVILMGIMMSMKRYGNGLRVFWLVLGILGTVVSLRALLKANRKEEDRRVSQVADEHHEYMAHWTIPPDLWNQFLDVRLIWQHKGAKVSGWTLGIVLGLVAASITFQNLVLAEAFLFTFGVVLVGYVAGLYGALKMAHNLYKKDQLFENSEVYFARDLLVFNGRLIQLKDFGVRPVEVKLREDHGLTLLAIKVQTGLGNRKSVKQHWIVVPGIHLEEAKKLCEHYASLV